MNRAGTYVVTGLIVLVLVASGLFLFTRDSEKKTESAGADSQANTTGQEQTNETVAEDNVVVIKNHAYAPAKITVKKGTTVTWTNQDITEHDVTPDNPTADFKQSSMLGRGDSYSVTFNETGTFTYFCSPHPFMTGVVEVVE